MSFMMFNLIWQICMVGLICWLTKRIRGMISEIYNDLRKYSAR